MRPIKQTIAAAGQTPWVMIDYLQATFNAGLAVVPSSGGTITAKVEFTMDDLAKFIDTYFTQSTTTVTLTYPAHGASVADSVILQASPGTAGAFTNIDGTYQIVSVVDANTVTVTVTPSQTVTPPTRVQATLARVFTASAPLASISARVNGNIVVPAYACRLNVSAITGTVDFIVMQGT